MKLHIFPDDKFVDDFISRIESWGLVNNRFIVNTERNRLQSVKKDIPFAPINSRAFKQLVGNTLDYEVVYIHYLPVSLYRFILTNRFKKIGWMVWGADLYELPFIQRKFYEPQTYTLLNDRGIVNFRRRKSFFYRLKYRLVTPFVYAKVSMICTWMPPEYNFAVDHLPFLKRATHKYFRYGFPTDWEGLRTSIKNVVPNARPAFILGNSGSYANNHLDLFQKAGSLIEEASVPLSYGNPRYVDLVVEQLSAKYPHFKPVREYMTFDQYISFIQVHTGIIMNTIRPQGMGNIWLMFFLGKLVFLNPESLVFKFFAEEGFEVFSLSELKHINQIISNFNPEVNRTNLLQYFSDDKLRQWYQDLFS